MKQLLTAFAIVLLFASCQKEGSFEDPTRTPGGGTSGGGTTNSNRLVRIGIRLGTDSITTNFGYNASGSLVSFIQSGTVTGIPITAEAKYVRNAANIITSTVVKNEALAQFGLDSVEAFHTYDPANARYKHSISRITIFGETETDSIVFVYNAGKLAEAIDYYDEGTGSGYVPLTKETYAYSGSNLSQIKSYSYNDQTRSYDLDETINYEFDTKLNPMQFAAVDAPVTSMRLFYSANNALKTTTVQAGSSTPVVATVAYTYNTNNKPLTAISGSGTVTSKSTYYYQ